MFISTESKLPATITNAVKSKVFFVKNLYDFDLLSLQGKLSNLTYQYFCSFSSSKNNYFSQKT